jgi:uncharacterized protein YqiB (DUF1249 family)
MVALAITPKAKAAFLLDPALNITLRQSEITAYQVSIGLAQQDHELRRVWPDAGMQVRSGHDARFARSADK